MITALQSTAHQIELEKTRSGFCVQIAQLKANIRLMNQKVCEQPCPGFSSKYVEPIIGHGVGMYFGKLLAQYLYNVAVIQGNECGVQIPHSSFHEFRRVHAAETTELQGLLAQLPLYQMSNECLRSVMCSSHNSVNGACAMCSALAMEQSIRKRIQRHDTESPLHPNKYTRIDRIHVSALVGRVRQAGGAATDLYFQASKAKAALQVSERKVCALEEKMASIPRTCKPRGSKQRWLCTWGTCWLCTWMLPVVGRSSSSWA